MKLIQRAFDVLGNIAIVNFPREIKPDEKKKFAKKLLKENKSVKTVLEKKGRIKGRLRKISTNYLAGEKTKEVLYRENNCAFRFNIDTTYFSPRLSNERKEIASKIKKNENVLVMFAGVSPFPIVIAKNSSAKKIYSNELNREANKYAKLNIELNNLKDRVELVPGDAKKIAKKLKEDGKKFEVIVMPRPQLKDSFLEQAFMLSKKNTRIYYYDFCEVEKINLVIEKIKNEAKKSGKKIKILEIKKAGEIAPYKIRLRVDFKII
jgi:tRNA (guanine37-N1)-methyltransferase